MYVKELEQSVACCASHLQMIRARLRSLCEKANLAESEISIGDRVTSIVVDLEQTILDVIYAIKENDKKLTAMEKTGYCNSIFKTDTLV